MDQACANGIDDVAPLSRAEILALEPALSPQLRAGFRVPREFVIDPWSAPTAYLLQALANGAEVRRGCELLGGSFDGDAWRLETDRKSTRLNSSHSCATRMTSSA